MWNVCIHSEIVGNAGQLHWGQASVYGALALPLYQAAPLFTFNSYRKELMM